MAIGALAGLLVGPFLALSHPSAGEVVLVSVLVSVSNGMPPYLSPASRALRARVVRAGIVAIIVAGITGLAVVIENGLARATVVPSDGRRSEVWRGESRSWSAAHSALNGSLTFLA